MTDARRFWKALYERCDPEDPVTNPSWRAERNYSPAIKILQGLSRDFGDKKYLFYGSIGAGKSTELHYIAESRAADNFVVVVDLDRHFSTVIGDPDALQHIQAWEVVLLVALGLLRATQERFGHEWDASDIDALQRAAARLAADDEGGASLDVMKLASMVTVFVGGAVVGPTVGAALGKGIELLGKAAESGTWRLRLGRRPRVDDQDERASALLEVVNNMLGITRQKCREVTLLIDGLDRLEEIERIEALFVRSRMISQLAAPTIMTGPLALSHMGIANRIRGFKSFPLANLPVMDQRDPSQHANGVRVGVEAYRLRTRDLDPHGSRMDDASLARLAYGSGGVMREFMHLIREVAEQAWDRKLETVDRSTVDAAVDTRRRLYEEGLDDRVKSLLATVAQSRSLPDDESVPRLLRNWWLVPYPNESVWWHPHPLLMISALADKGAS